LVTFMALPGTIFVEPIITASEAWWIQFPVSNLLVPSFLLSGIIFVVICVHHYVYYKVEANRDKALTIKIKN
jgi:hypothetical protein